VKCIESEYTTQGEFLLWETSVPTLQKGTDVSVRTFEAALKLLRDQHIIDRCHWSRYKQKYVVGFEETSLNRFWMPCTVAKPYLVKLPTAPKHLNTRFLYNVINYQIQIELLKSGLNAYFGEDLKGPKYPTMSRILLEILNSAKFRQAKLLNMLRAIAHNPPKTKVFSVISADLEKSTKLANSYLVANKELLESLGPQKHNSVVTNLLVSKNTKIRNTISSFNSNKYAFSEISPTPEALTHSKSKLYTHSRTAKVTKTPANITKQQILDSFWNARKCVFGVYRTIQMADGFTQYSADLPQPFRKFRNEHKDRVPSRSWCSSDEFHDWAITFAVAYNEMEQFKQGAKTIGDRRIVSGEDKQFKAMQYVFFREFKRAFGRSAVEVLGISLDFYIDWCVFRAVSNFRIAKTYFEHRTGIEATLLHYVLAQVSFIHFRSQVTPIKLKWLYEPEARLRMEEWIEENDPDAYISRERKQQLAKFFAEQKV
jgi:hypothetical protein